MSHAGWMNCQSVKQRKSPVLLKCDETFALLKAWTERPRFLRLLRAFVLLFFLNSQRVLKFFDLLVIVLLLYSIEMVQSVWMLQVTFILFDALRALDHTEDNRILALHVEDRYAPSCSTVRIWLLNFCTMFLSSAHAMFLTMLSGEVRSLNALSICTMSELSPASGMPNSPSY